MRIILLFVLIIGVSANVFAAVDQSDRRIEEEKRIDLKPTEAQYYDSSQAQVDEEITLDYFDRLLQKETATHADAAYVIAVLLGESAMPKDFNTQKQFLIEGRLLSEKRADKFSERSPLRRGQFAYLLFRGLDLRGGLTIRVLGVSERYAHRELVHEGIMISGSSGEYMSGQELIYSFVQATNYLARENSP